MNTVTAYQFHLLNIAGEGKFPHTGPVYYGSGKMPFTAALKGKELKDRAGRYNRTFKTAEAAIRAIEETAEA